MDQHAVANPRLTTHAVRATDATRALLPLNASRLAGERRAGERRAGGIDTVRLTLARLQSGVSGETVCTRPSDAATSNKILSLS